MIGYLKGKITYLEPGYLILDVSGTGYELTISLQLYEFLNGKPQTDYQDIWVHTVHKEDNLKLFGFAAKKERDFFRMLLALPGVGPAMGMSLNSSMTQEEFLSVLEKNELSYLTRIPGVGKGKAERILFEFKKKYSKWLEREIKNSEAASSRVYRPGEDAVLGLVSLGYESTQAHRWVMDYVKGLPGDKKEILSAGEVIRDILRKIAKK